MYKGERRIEVKNEWLSKRRRSKIRSTSFQILTRAQLSSFYPLV